MPQGLHALEGSLGQLGLLLCALRYLVHEHRHRLSIGLGGDTGETEMKSLAQLHKCYVQTIAKANRQRWDI